MRRYLWKILISVDQFFNTLLGGSEDETISSRANRAREGGKAWGKVTCSILDKIDPNHCSKSKGV